MKIALCTDFFFPIVGGISSHIAGLASELERRGNEVVIISKYMNNAPKNFQQIKSRRVIYTKPLASIPILLMPPIPSEMKKVFIKEKFDIIHAHHAFTPTSLLSIHIAKKLGIPAILTNHTTFLVYDREKIWVPLSYILYPFRKYINEADLIIAVSNSATNSIRHFTRDDKIVIVPNGVDVNFFNSDHNFSNKATYQAYDDPIILYVGRLVYCKGIHILVKAMPYILKDFPNTHLIIVGEGYMKKPIELFVKNLKLEKNVSLIGFVPYEELPNLYSLSHVFVLPSLHCESFGITLLEAMASGKPVVASKIGGIPEIIENEKTGLLFKRGDAMDLASKVLNILNNHNFAQTLACNAQKLVMKKYDWSIIVDKIETLYEYILSIY